MNENEGDEKQIRHACCSLIYLVFLDMFGVLDIHSRRGAKMFEGAKHFCPEAKVMRTPIFFQTGQKILELLLRTLSKNYKLRWQFLFFQKYNYVDLKDLYEPSCKKSEF